MADVEKKFVIEVCSSNAFLDDIKTVDWLSQTYPDVAVEPDECLDRCGICMRYTYCVINGDFLYANSMNELKGMIVSYIESHRAGMEEAKNFLDQGKTE